MSETTERTFTSHPPTSATPRPCRPHRGRPRLLLTTLGLAVMAACGFAAAEGDPGAPSDAELRQAVGAAYGTLERLAAASDADLVFELEEFTTHDLGELHTLHLSDLRTPPGGATIDGALGNRSTNRDGELVGQRVVFAPRWHDRDAAEPGPVEAQVGTSQTVGQLIPILAEGDARFHDLRAATTFRVRASLAGRSRDYRAVVFSFDIDAGSAAAGEGESFLLLDPVTGAAEAAFRAAIETPGQQLAARPGTSPQ